MCKKEDKRKVWFNMKKVAVLLAEGFEEIEALTVVDILRRAAIHCDCVSISDKKEIKGAHDIIIKSDKNISEEILSYDMIVLPGGVLGAENLSNSETVLHTIRLFMKNDEKYVAAICASPAVVLSKIDLIKEKNITSYPGKDYEEMLKNANYKNETVVQDGNLITSRGPATTMAFAYKLVDVLGKDSSKLKKGMLYEE